VIGALANGDALVVMSSDKPVFSDDSGVRAAALKWGVWAICFIAVLLGGSLVLILRTHVPLPGMDPPPSGQIEAVPATEESTSQPYQPSITFRPSPTATSPSARPSPTAPRPSARPSSTATGESPRPSVAVKRAAPSLGATSAARKRTTAQAKSSDRGTTKPRNPKAATPSPPGSQATSKPGNGPG
jgi:cytoskeletal protein RodZ